MRIQELRDLTKTELLEKRRDLEEELFNLRMRRSISPLENPLRLRQIGRDIARILTVVREDEKGIRKVAQSKASILGTTPAKPSKGK